MPDLRPLAEAVLREWQHGASQRGRAMGTRAQVAESRIRAGDCVRLADGRTGRVRAVRGRTIRVRVRRRTSATHQFVTLPASSARRVDCPKGWMSPAGYARYLRVTLAKMRTRLARKAARHPGER